MQNSTGLMAWHPKTTREPSRLRFLNVEINDVINYWPGRLLIQFRNLQVGLWIYYTHLNIKYGKEANVTVDGVYH